jgi:hypothetical protein
LDDGYEGAAESARQELAIAESQLRAFQSRLGAPFAYEAYLTELSALREQLRIAGRALKRKKAKQRLTSQSASRHYGISIAWNRHRSG